MIKLLYVSLTTYPTSEHRIRELETVAILPWVLRRFDGCIISTASVGEVPDATCDPLVQRALSIAHDAVVIVYWGRRVFNTHDRVDETPYKSPFTWSRAISNVVSEARALGCLSFLYCEPHGKSTNVDEMKAGFSMQTLKSLEYTIATAKYVAGRGVDLAYPGGGRQDGSSQNNWHYSWPTRIAADGYNWLNHATYRVHDPAEHQPAVPTGYDPAITHWGSHVSDDPDAEASPTGVKPLSVDEWVNFDESKLPATVHTRWCYISEDRFANTAYLIGKSGKVGE